MYTVKHCNGYELLIFTKWNKKKAKPIFRSNFKRLRV